MKYIIQEILQIAHDDFDIKYPFISTQKARVLDHILKCKTASMGGHKCICDDCGNEMIHYNSCRDRHCPCCQTLVKEKWIDKTKASLVDAPYYHITITVPHSLHPIFLSNQKIMYNLFYKCVADTLKEISCSPMYKIELETGFMCILHTWNQQLRYHPHIHVIFLAGGFNKNHQFKHHSHDFLIHHKVLAGKFKSKFMKALDNLWRFDKLEHKPHSDSEYSKLKLKLFQTKWKSDVRQTFKNAKYVIEYLGRYTHRIVISNSRIVNYTNIDVTFRYNDRKDNNKTKLMTLSIKEFARRFLMHVLPYRFVKIRYYSILSNRNKLASLEIIKETTNTKLYVPELIDMTTEEILLKIFDVDISKCKKCGSKNIHTCKMPKEIDQIQLE